MEEIKDKTGGQEAVKPTISLVPPIQDEKTPANKEDERAKRQRNIIEAFAKYGSLRGAQHRKKRV